MVKRDDAFIDNLVYLETEFWGWVTSGTRPPMDGSENARRVLARMHPRNDGTLLQPDPAFDRVFLDWMAAREELAHAEAAADTLANAIRALIGDADGVEGRVTWKKNRDSTRVDWPTVANEVGLSDPELLAATIAAHTSTVEGARVLRPVKGALE
jgi:predicted phage-related endonuclease